MIQQHDATRLHWDLRLEHDGVLASWAVHRGLPWSPKTNHLAVHTEDHPMEYLDFEGDIPDGNYGAGKMTVWDRGTYEPEKFTSNKVTVVLHGQKVSGRYASVQTKGRDWMVHRMDPPVDPSRQPVPDNLRPMIAAAGPLPSGTNLATEIRWDGVRTLLTSSGGIVTLSDKSGDDRSAAFPEVRRVGRALGYTEVVLDGVITVVDADGRPVEGAIHRRLEAKSDSTVRRIARSTPAVVQLFDVLWLNGYSTVDLAWSERRTLLEGLELDGPAWKTPSAHLGDPAPIADAARSAGLSGVVVKTPSSPYRPGAETSDWIETRF